MNEYMKGRAPRSEGRGRKARRYAVSICGESRPTRATQNIGEPDQGGKGQAWQAANRTEIEQQHAKEA